MRSIVIAFLFSSLVCSGQSSPAHTNTILQQAITQARAEQKNVLVIFTASWCGWCHRMKKSLEDSTCTGIFSKYYVTRYLVTEESDGKKQLENPGADSLKQKYNGSQQGLPYWFILDKNGDLLADSRMLNPESGKMENTGCPATEKEVGYFTDVLQKTSAINKVQLEIVRKRFRMNEQ